MISEWMTETLSLILSFEMSHPNTKDKLIVPLSQTLSHQKNHPSLSVWYVFLLIIVICQTKGEWRDSILFPWKINERRMTKKNKQKNNDQWKSEMQITKGYQILCWRFTSNWKKTCQKKCPQKFENQTFSFILSSNSFSYSHIVSGLLSQIKSLSIFLMISYIFQWLIRSMLQKFFNTFYAPIMSSKMQRCLSKYCQKKANIFQHIHFIHPVRWDICHICWVRNWHNFSFSPLFLHIHPIPLLFLLLSTTAPSTLPNPQWKWSQNIPPEMKDMRKTCENPD